MRARYSAFALKDAEFLAKTGPDRDLASLEASFARTQWVRLEVERTEAGGVADQEGYVTFSATFLEKWQFGVLQERSRFGRVDGKWRYLEGNGGVRMLRPGRNAPCPCGSGRKSKSCPHD